MAVSTSVSSAKNGFLAFWSEVMDVGRFCLMMEEEGAKAAVVARVVTMIVALNWTMFACLLACLLYDMCYCLLFTVYCLSLLNILYCILPTSL